jgi:hypothetical protein
LLVDDTNCNCKVSWKAVRRKLHIPAIRCEKLPRDGFTFTQGHRQFKCAACLELN